jgi:hypothetical protein
MNDDTPQDQKIERLPYPKPRIVVNNDEPIVFVVRDKKPTRKEK